MNNHQDKYLGAKKIKLTQPAGQTRGGVDLVKVTFDDNSSEIYSVLMLEAEKVVTPTASDASTLQACRIFPVVQKVLEVMRDYNLKMSEVNYLTTMIITSVNENFDRADQILWDIKYLTERTMNDVDNVLSNKKPTLDDVLGPGNSA